MRYTYYCTERERPKVFEPGARGSGNTKPSYTGCKLGAFELSRGPNEWDLISKCPLSALLQFSATILSNTAHNSPLYCLIISIGVRNSTVSKWTHKVVNQLRFFKWIFPHASGSEMQIQFSPKNERFEKNEYSQAIIGLPLKSLKGAKNQFP